MCLTVTDHATTVSVSSLLCAFCVEVRVLVDVLAPLLAEEVVGALVVVKGATVVDASAPTTSRNALTMSDMSCNAVLVVARASGVVVVVVADAVPLHGR
mmetsp:Transcript_33720/g.95954  ORF Transcript_33720/g.95954 Transcript_33720/m.95954 type:complete len:99 (+) Transcript_33720:318-614(+)